MSAGYARIKNRVLEVMGEEGEAVMDYINDLREPIFSMPDLKINEGMNGRFFVKSGAKVVASFVDRDHAEWFVKNAGAPGQIKTG